MTKEDSEKIVSQLQQAHRISVAFYHRILPTLDNFAEQLGCRFWTWEPMYTNRPGRSSSQPSKAWAWDFVPLFASTFTYYRTSGEKRTGPEEIAVQFELLIDDSFIPENRKLKGEPSAVEMPFGKAILKAYMYRPKAAFDSSFEDLWDEDGEREVVFGVWTDVSEHWECKAIELALSEVIQDSKSTARYLQEQSLS